MPHLLSGQLAARLCQSSECVQPVSASTLRFYRPARGQDTEQRVAAAAKATFAILTDKDAEAKTKHLLGETTTDADGRFSISFDPNAQYDGGPIEVDVRFARVPGAERQNDRGPVQATLTTFQPEWDQDGNNSVATWSHSISARLWCYVLALFDVWVICGRVISATGGDGIGNLTVRAFDRDWLQDDPLGEAITSDGGRFRIYYTSDDFKPTVFPGINVELTPGPDLYFDVLSAAGASLLDESPEAGRNAPRENVGHCHCETLRVSVEGGPGPNDPYDAPYFTHVGNFDILYDIDVSGLANKRKTGAGGAGYGFYGRAKLKGYCPKTRGGAPLYYRFLYLDPATGAETPVTGEDLLEPVVVGSKLISWDVGGDGTFGLTLQDIIVAGSGETMPLADGGSGPIESHVIVPDANGWIAVDPQGLNGGFYGPLARLKTERIVPGGGASGAARDGEQVEIIFETTTNREDSSAFERQTDTVTLLVNNWLEVRELELAEFATGSVGDCTGLTDEVSIQYRTDHQLLHSWRLSISSAATASGWMAPTLLGGSSPRGASGEQVVDTDGNGTAFAMWPACSYVVRLTSRRMLTDGEDDDRGGSAQRMFCKA